MTSFAHATSKRSLKPARHVVLEPSAFEDTWKDKPGSAVAIGLRKLSIEEEALCRLEAEREASGVYDEHPEGSHVMGDVIVEHYNELVLCELMAKACCNPNDVTQPYFEHAAVTIRLALSSAALERLWDEYLILTRGSSLLIPPASDTELRLLGRALRAETFRAKLDNEGRKLCTYLLEKFEKALPPDGDGDDIAQDEEDDLLERDSDDDEDEETTHVSLAE